jgi:elongator complex protein 1
MERKIGSGRKGTVDEEEYLLKSVSKLVEKFAVTKGMLLSVVIALDGENSNHLF